MNASMELAIHLIQDLAVVLLAATLAGWICRRIGISQVVGYLAAGIIVGTPQITFPYVTDMERIQTLSQLGLVFLMFFIGLSFRLRKLRELGFGVVAATAATALITLTLTRIAANALGFSEAESLFLAGMLMVSSSAIVGKVLQENGLIHERAGQLAMAVTLLEDLVAIVLLAWLGSYAAVEPSADQGWLPLAITLGSLAAFVALLLVPGLIFLPKILQRFGQRGETELETILVAGLMFGMALLTIKAGFSLALGAFLCGMIVAESSRLRSIVSTFSGLRDIFVTVFFTAIGMSINLTHLPDALGLIALGVALAFAARVFASATGLLLAAESDKTALKAALCLTPIGEFSFVIAGLGISSGILDERFQIAAVGISLLTSLFSPLLMKRADQIARVLAPSRFRPVGDALEIYRRLWNSFDLRRKKSLIWRIVAPRVWQIVREILLVTALLAFARPVFAAFETWLQNSYPNLAYYVDWYWLAIALIALPPLVALYRNINAITMIIGDFLTEGQRHDGLLKRGVTLILRALGFSLLSAWLFNLIPFLWVDPQFIIAIILIALLGAVLGWRKLIKWHSHAEIALTEVMDGDSSESQASAALRETSGKWGMSLTEFRVPDPFLFAGKSIAQIGLRKTTGASVVGLERQGYHVGAVGPGTHLFPGDTLYLVGSPSSLEGARLHLAQTAPEQPAPLDLTAAVLDHTAVSESSLWIGKTLAELRWPNLFGVQVVAVERHGERVFSPSSDWRIAPGDSLLLAGNRNAIEELKSSG